jgi:hypothetical protein
MSPELKSLLFDIRQHPAFLELLRTVERPRLARFRPSQKLTLEQVGANASYESGQIAQDNNWRTLLTGEDYETKE